MPWTEISAVDDRLCFISSVLRDEGSMSALCAQHGISRKTGYKWLTRYRECGVAGLVELSRARHTQPAVILPEMAQRLLALRAARPSWGPRKLLAFLSHAAPHDAYPAASTVGDLLRREGASRPRQRAAREPAGKGPQVAASAPNESWGADMKGWFRTADGVRCEPFTVTDGYSRYILAAQAVAQADTAHIQPILQRLFEEHGMPRALRTDNGSPFAHRSGLGGLSRQSVWLLKLDIWPDRIVPGRPDQNGSHERMHRTLAEEAARPASATLAAQQARLDAWRHDFNHNRPHEALGQRCPVTVWQPSPRRYPQVIAQWDYPADHTLRRVNSKGYIRWRDTALYLTEALAGDTAALARRDDGDWVIRFRGFDLAVLDDASNSVRRCGLARTARAGSEQRTQPEPA